MLANHNKIMHVKYCWFTFQEWGEGEIKDSSRGGEFKYDIFDTL
jgi:hypothetical protein